MRIRLVPLTGGEPIELRKALLLVGRKEDCDICVPHKSISKQHCILVQTDGMVFLRDLGSTNGTRVNGQRVRRAALLPNDRLSFAGVPYKVVFGEAVIEGGNTEQLDGKELEELKKMNADKGDNDDFKESANSGPTGPPSIVQNQLPDVF